MSFQQIFCVNVLKCYALYRVWDKEFFLLTVSDGFLLLPSSRNLLMKFSGYPLFHNMFISLSVLLSTLSSGHNSFVLKRCKAMKIGTMNYPCIISKNTFLLMEPSVLLESKTSRKAKLFSFSFELVNLLAE